MHTGNENVYIMIFSVLQVIYIITHGTNAELSCREIKERTRKAMEAITLHQLFKEEHTFFN